MQDFQPNIPGLMGRIFPDHSIPNPTRRFHNHHPSSSPSSPPTKCPRCDSTNTKFCYYNNYNLSQPRHFCKSCRRYWTKGGVLRNVPVGGGCRKSSGSSSKRSKPKPDRQQPAPAPAPAAASASASGSSSESSSNPPPNPNPDPIMEQPMFAQADFGFSFSDPGGLLTEEQQKLEGSSMGGLDWGANGSDSGSLFDMTSSVDPAVLYWNQSHWGDPDPSLYLP